MIFFRNVSLDFGERKLFDKVNLSIYPNQKIGIVGLNGSGKSTLLKAIAEASPIDDGEIVIERNKIIAYMPQELTFASTKSVFDETLSVFEKFIVLEKTKEKLEAQFSAGLEGETYDLEYYVKVLEQLENYDKENVSLKVEKILLGLGFSRAQFDTQVSSLSFGWKMRLVLAKLLLEDADFYLFDEPTNHLDITAKSWFLDFLKNSSAGFLLVSHDRHFLDHACDTIIELENGSAKHYKGNYSIYLEQKAANEELLRTKYINQQKDIARREKTIERFRVSASKAKMAQSMIKQLDRIERIELNDGPKKVSFHFPKFQESGRLVLTFKNLSKNFGERLIFKDASGIVEKGEKVALVAANGVGKTTLLNVIVGKYENQDKHIEFGYNVNYVFFEQDQVTALNPNNTIFDEVQQNCPDASESDIRRFLGAFLFSGDDAFKKINVLSGGERNRVGMIKVLLKKANFLILDEPTNHLDLQSKEILLNALNEYHGTILFVSHDIDFINNLATKVFELTSNGLGSYEGNFDSFLEYQKSQSFSVAGSKANIKNISIANINKGAKEQLDNNAKKSIKALETQIAKLEKDIETINQTFFSASYGTKEYDNLTTKLKNAQDSLNKAYHEWEQLSQK